VQDRDARQHEAVRDRDEDVVEVRVCDRADADDEEVRDAGGGDPDAGLLRVDYFGADFF
jgi:hypothetical protein